jgi:hypothetical protein
MKNNTNTETWTLTKRNNAKCKKWTWNFWKVLREKQEGIETEIKIFREEVGI